MLKDTYSIIKRKILLKTWCAPFIIVILMLINSAGFAQTPTEIRMAKKVFTGAWVNKKTTRHLTISMEKEGYATINDWTSKYQKQESGDAYKAFIEHGKLIMPAEKEHHAPYSEMTVKNNTLTYVTKFVDFKGKIILEKLLFQRAH
ncbi:hypothetical protein ACVWYN_000005 [Pedobacter sp. UYP24]